MTDTRGPSKGARRTFEEQLSDSQTRLELATRAGGIGIWDWNVQTNEMIYSEQAKSIFGFPPNQPVNFEQVRDATHPEDLPRTSAMARRALDPGLHEKEPYEYRIVRPDGAVRWVLAQGQAYFSNGGTKAVRYIGTIQDITERKRLEQTLQETQARLELAFQVGRVAVWDYKGATASLNGSPELNILLGFPPDKEVSSDEYRSRYAPGERERLQEVSRAALERRDPYIESEVKFLLPDGTVRWLLFRADFLWPDGSAVPDCLGVVVDITDRKLAEEHMQFLVEELNHRVKNTLAVVQSIFAQTLRGSADGRDTQARFEGRLRALARAHDLLNVRYQRGADLREIVEASVTPHAGQRGNRMNASGPALMLPPRLALSFALILHELATNALKYGALSTDGGTVAIDWSRKDVPEGVRLSLTWREKGGPPVTIPEHRGFGSQMIERGLSGEPGGSVNIDYRPDGLACTIALIVPPAA